MFLLGGKFCFNFHKFLLCQFHSTLLKCLECRFQVHLSAEVAYITSNSKLKHFMVFQIMPITEDSSLKGKLVTRQDFDGLMTQLEAPIHPNMKKRLYEVRTILTLSTCSVLVGFRPAILSSTFYIIINSLTS